MSSAIQAVLLISDADPKGYTKLKNSLKVEYSWGHYNYPTTFLHALNMLNIHKVTLHCNYTALANQKIEDRLAFLQADKKLHQIEIKAW